MYTKCTDTNSFTLASLRATSRIDSQCTLDYIIIDSSQGGGMCSAIAPNAPINTRFCGRNLNAAPTLAADSPICGESCG